MRRCGRILLVAGVVGVGFLYPMLAPTPHRIDTAHCELIRGGMTKADVEAIFGVPPGQYDWAEPDPLHTYYVHLVTMVRWVQNEEALQRQPRISSSRAFEASVGETWVSRHGAFTIQFNSDNGVVSKRGPRGVRIVPPWQRWWKAIWER
jgi:hypothetical protein